MFDETPRKPGPNTVAGIQARTELGRWRHDPDRRDLTEGQARFALLYAENGGNGRQAALACGIPEDQASTVASRFVRLPWVARAIEVERRRLLSRVGLRSLKVILGVLEDDKADPKLRVKAAEIGLKADRADRDDVKDSGAGKSLNQMTVVELEALCRRLGQAAEQAQLPIIEGVSEQIDGATSIQAIDPAVESTAL